MRSSTLLYTLTALMTAAAASSVPVQQPSQPDAQLPFVMDSSPFVPSSSSPTLADLLTKSRSASIFYEYARESASVSTLLINPLAMTTLLVPVNSAILALARKPHQGPPPEAITAETGYRGSEEDEQARQAYVERWIKLHMIRGERVDLDAEGWEGREWETMGKERTVKFLRGGDDGNGRKLMPGNIDVISQEEVAIGLLTFMNPSTHDSHSQASNGIILYLRGTLSLETDK
ncbi:hypothetical protein JCM1841_002693 [Sporobolomyces salmonicolor]